MSKRILFFLLLLFGSMLYLAPVPFDINIKAWHLFAIFITAIFSILLNILPIITASVLALFAAIITGTMAPDVAYKGFSEGFILLIVVAFLVSHAIYKSGLGKRLSLMVIRRFGSTTLGLGYSLVATDMLISPAFPSNTARSGVLYPIVYALAKSCGSSVGDGTQKRAGSYLMMTSMSGIAISSALWLTAMAANPIGANMAKSAGVEITFLSWFFAALVPTLAAFVVVPYLLYRIFPPELKDTPHAPQEAKEQLEKMGAFSKNEKITSAVFISMLLLWVVGGVYGIDKTAVAFGGLGVLLLSGVFSVDDFKSQGEVLNTFIWFSILFAMSSELAHLGFMDAVAMAMSPYFAQMEWIFAYVALVSLYVLFHYFFVSQSAHMLSLFAIFFSIGISSGVDGELMALMLLFATNFNAVLTPQGSSANAIYLSSEYITPREVYIYGGAVTLANLVIFLLIGTPWIVLIG